MLPPDHLRYFGKKKQLKGERLAANGVDYSAA
jgi:hypothetical protein